MVLTGKEDLRVQKTIAAIDKAFEEMLIEKDYRKITVKELTERARINKKTFYRYYECIDDLLVEKQETIITECLQNIEKYKVPDELDKIIKAQFQFFHTKGGLYEKVFCCGPAVTGIDYSGICQYTKKRYWEKSPEIMALSEETRNILLRFINRNVITFYSDWFYGGKKEPLEEVTAAAVTLICTGVFGMV
ncbi:MAG: TetR/AcrR family transcriptional regulator [Eubacterium sp.]|nr:TetR/AcrR family transcriptional regulator [Eubacterium sp.]